MDFLDFGSDEEAEEESRTPTAEDKAFGSQGQAKKSGLLRAESSSSSEEEQEVAAAEAHSDMANSYHEIFDAQMPPEKAKSALRDQDKDNERGKVDEELAERLSSLTQEGTTEYLTKKLVTDSLK